MCGQPAREQWQEEGRRQRQERQQVPRLGLCGGRQLRTALLPGGQALLRAQEAQEQRHRGAQGNRAQTRAGVLPHAARAEALRCAALFHVMVWPKAVSQEAVWCTTTRMIGRRLCATRWSADELNRPSREPVADWRRHRDSHTNVTNPLDTAWHQRFSGAANAARAVAADRDMLDLMGDWRDSVRSQQSEKTGAVESAE